MVFYPPPQAIFNSQTAVCLVSFLAIVAPLPPSSSQPLSFMTTRSVLCCCCSLTNPSPCFRFFGLSLSLNPPPLPGVLPPSLPPLLLLDSEQRCEREVCCVTWHGKGDYLASVSRGESRRAVMIHQLSKASTQCPFRKTKVWYTRIYVRIAKYFFCC